MRVYKEFVGVGVGLDRRWDGRIFMIGKWVEWDGERDRTI